ncbi:MAG: CRISPR-associated protein Cas4, partial [Armatimonadota bacterium]
RWVAEADIVQCFDSLSHDRLLERWSAQHPELSSLIRKWLTSGVVDGQTLSETTRGVPQGGVISPLLCNVYLHQLDTRLSEKGHELTRYADDFVLQARTEREARRALRDAAEALTRIDLRLSGPKSRVCSFEDGFTFLGARFVGDEVERPRTGRYGGGAGGGGTSGGSRRGGESPASHPPPPVWLSGDTSPPDALPISSVATYAFCPRAFYLRQVCGESVDTPRMEAGRVQHRIRRMAGGAGNLYFDVPVASPGLGLRGRLDAVYAKWNTWVPIEFKFSRAERLHDSHRLQLAAQAVAIEDTTAHTVLAGYVEFLPRQAFRCVSIDDELRRRLAAAVENMWDIMSSREPPEPVDDGRCRWCSMRPVCQPGLAEQFEGMIA